MSIHDIFHHRDMQVPLLVVRPVVSVRAIEEVMGGVIIPEGFGKALCSLLVLCCSNDTNSAVRCNDGGCVESDRLRS